MKKALAYEIVKEMRQRKGVSQKELADKVGLTQQAIALLENGKRKLEFDLFIKILNELETTQSELHKIINSIFDNNVTPKPEETQTLAAHFDCDEYTEEELDEIKKFAEFVKSKRDN